MHTRVPCIVSAALGLSISNWSTLILTCLALTACKQPAMPVDLAFTVPAEAASGICAEGLCWSSPINKETFHPGKLIQSLAQGGTHHLAVRRDGKLKIWGTTKWAKDPDRVFENLNYGQLKVPRGLGPIRAVAGGWLHNLALKQDGTVLVWGDRYAGQGDVPAELYNLHVVALAAGYRHSLALTEGGRVFAWGGQRASAV